jgi:predicted Zn-dependent protease
LGAGYYFSAPTVEVPITGRKYRRLVPREISNWVEMMMVQSIIDEYNDSILPPEHPLVRQVESIGNVITDANGLERHTYIVIDSDEINAFVAGGNIVFVYTGILPALANPSGTAMVLAHEMAHVRAGHTNEGMTMLAITLAISLALEVFGAGSQIATGLWSIFIQLPKQRDAELEADLIGYALMSNAGFDRREAVRVFERMRDATGEEEESPLEEWIRTHPIWQTRIDLLQDCVDSDTRPIEWVRLPDFPPVAEIESIVEILDDEDLVETPTGISTFASSNQINPIVKLTEWLRTAMSNRSQTIREQVNASLSLKRKKDRVTQLKALFAARLDKAVL